MCVRVCVCVCVCVRSRRQQSVSHGVAGWKLFGKVPPKQSPSKQARIIQQVLRHVSSSTVKSCWTCSTTDEFPQENRTSGGTEEQIQSLILKQLQLIGQSMCDVTLPCFPPAERRGQSELSVLSGPAPLRGTDPLLPLLIIIIIITSPE